MDIFEVVIELDDEVSHESGESHFGGFAAFDQMFIDALESGVMTTGHQCGHIEFSTDLGPSPPYETSTVLVPTISGIGSDPGQSRSGASVQRAQLGHLRQKGA